MGAAGAGLATFLSNCSACVYFFILLAVKKDKTNICLSPKYLSLRKEIVLGVLGVGVPASIQNILNVTGIAVMNNFVAAYGASAVAAIGISQKIFMVPIQIAMGGTQGVIPLIGYSYAGKNTRRFQEAISSVAKIMVPCMLVITIFYWILASPLMSLFIKSREVVAYGKLFLRGFSLSMPFMLLDFLAVSVFQSIGMGKKSLLFAVLRKIIFEIPAIVL